MAKIRVMITCGSCRSEIPVPPNLYGKTGNCPQCDAPVQYPIPKGNIGKRIKTRCDHCQAVLTLPLKALNNSVNCPKCDQAFAVTRENSVLAKPTKEKELSVQKARREKKREEVNPETFNAWKVMERAKEDSFWVAMWRACLYPYQAMGVLLFFVVGVPLTLAITEAVAKSTLLWGGGNLATPEKREYLAAGVVALSLAVAIAALSFFCSFLFAVVRVAAEGRQATPVIQGMYHRGNLSSVGAWATLHFGPALYVAFRAGEDAGTFLEWSGGAILLLVLLGFLAPINFLRAATASALDGVNPVGACRSMAKAFPQYMYLWVVLIVQAVLFLYLGNWAGGRADAAFSSDPPLYGSGIGFRIMQGLYYIMPVVVAARCLGKFLYYCGGKMPFEWDTQERSSKGQLLAQALMLAGVVVLFMPIYREAKGFVETSSSTMEAHTRMEQIFKMLHPNTDTKHHPASYEEFVKLMGKETLECPALPDTSPDYVFMPLPTKAPGKMIWVYETAPTYPDGETRHVLQYTGTIRRVKKGKLERLLRIQEKWLKQTDKMQKEMIERELIAEWSFVGTK